MILFFSGSGSKNDNPERVLKDACIMLSYYNNQKKPEKRFKYIYKQLKQAKEETNNDSQS